MLAALATHLVAMTTLALAEVRFRQFLSLAKPRVVSLIVFVAMIGMFLAVPDLPPVVPFVFGTVGIALVAGAAAAINCLVEQKVDALMARTRRRPLPSGELSSRSTLLFATLVGGLGLFLLYRFVNPLTMWLTLATFVGYAIIYTVLLKPATPQNIVIGGASGAMPPVLGWAAVTNDVPPEALLLFLIIFVWTPPHFWSLALYREQDYARAGLPMLPVTHGRRYTQLMIVLYTIALVAVTLLPFTIRMSGYVYLAGALALGGDVPRLRDSPLPRLQRRARARDVQVFGVVPRGAVLGAARRSLLAVIRTMLRVLLVAAVARWRSAACSPDAPKFMASDVTGTTFGRDFKLTDHDGQGAHARRLPRQGGGAVLRLHAMPRRLPDHARRAGRGDEAARTGRRPRAGAVRHRRPRARHARAPRRSTCRRSIRASSASTATPTPQRARRRNSR